jgi:regulatory protein
MTRKTIAEIKEKIIKFCLYQERSPWETLQKLQALNCEYYLCQQILTELILENYINEERFCYEYAYGKFTLKKWGRLKIKQGLLEHRVSQANLNSALQKAIDPVAYQKVLSEILKNKYNALPPTLSPYQKKMKAYQYAAQKGYEAEYIQEAIDSFLNPQSP